MSVNQSVNPNVVPGARVQIVKGDHVSGSFFELKADLIGKQGTVQYVDRGYTVYQPDAAVLFDDGTTAQVEMQNLYVVLAEPVRVSGEVNVTKVTTPRVNYLYVVEDEDGVYGKTFDRDHARELKASFGGKKAGVIITAYAAVKEIR